MSGLLQSILIPLLAVLTGLIIGAIVIVITDPVVVAAFGDFFQAPGAALAAAWKAVATAYGALFYGSFGSPGEIMSALKSGDPAAIRQAFWPFTESLVASTPYIFTGLAVGLGFKAGLFNIGAEGQFFMGSLGAAFVGYSLVGWPLVPAPAAGHPGRVRRRRDLGRHPRVAQGQIRRSRSGQHHHDELHRVPPE